MRAGTPLFAALIGCCVVVGAHAAYQIELPAGLGRDLVYAQCNTCHDLQYVKESAGITRDDWDAAIDGMRQYGLRIPPDQRAKILDYLATYLGPNPPPEQPAAPAGPELVDGAALYTEQCVACHQPNGRGVKDQFPPLAGNRDLFLSRDYPVKVVLFGLDGTIKVANGRFTGQMPSFAHLSDTQVAALVNHVRKAWNNDRLSRGNKWDVDAASVATIRRQEMTSEAVNAYRDSLL